MERLSLISHPRPALVTWISLGVLTFSGLQWAALFSGIRLPDLALSVPKGYLISRIIIFGLSSLGLALGLFFGRSWAPRWTRRTVIIIVIWMMLERTILSPSEYAIRTLPLITILAILIWAALSLALNRPNAKNFFQEYPA